jgi:Tfp pilus assembly protein PilO
MKKINVALNFFVAALAMVAITLFFYQFKKNFFLHKMLEEKKLELKNSEAASRHLEQLENQSVTLKDREAMLNRKIPVNEARPLSLVRELIGIGGKVGFRNVSFDLAGENNEMQMMESSGNEGLQGGMLRAKPVTSSEVQSSGAGGSAPKAIKLEMNFEGTFSQLLIFLEKLKSLERIIMVNQISIERKEDIMPYQMISLRLVTYTF